MPLPRCLGFIFFGVMLSLLGCQGMSINSLRDQSFRALQEGDFALALSSAELAILKAPQDWLPYSDKASALIGFGRYFEAAEIAEKAKSMAPSEPLPEFVLGNALFLSGQYEQAIIALETFLKLAPESMLQVPAAQAMLAEARNAESVIVPPGGTEEDLRQRATKGDILAFVVSRPTPAEQSKWTIRSLFFVPGLDRDRYIDLFMESDKEYAMLQEGTESYSVSYDKGSGRYARSSTVNLNGNTAQAYESGNVNLKEGSVHSEAQMSAGLAKIIQRSNEKYTNLSGGTLADITTEHEGIFVPSLLLEMQTSIGKRNSFLLAKASPPPSSESSSTMISQEHDPVPTPSPASSETQPSRPIATPHPVRAVDRPMEREASDRIYRKHQIKTDWQNASLSELTDIETRLDAVQRVNQKYGILFDWQKSTLPQLTDAEARMDAVVRIERNYGIRFDWTKSSLLQLTDAEARIAAANRLSLASGRQYNWSDFTLQQLIEEEARLSRGPAQVATSPTPRVYRQRPGAAADCPVYISKLDRDEGDVLFLANGGIVEITSGYLGVVGFHKEVILYKSGMQWKIWIEGKQAFSCDILKAPSVAPSGQGALVSIMEVKGDGSILMMLDGSIFEVSNYDTYNTQLWIGVSDALLIDGTRLINLREGGSIINVTRLK